MRSRVDLSPEETQEFRRKVLASRRDGPAKKVESEPPDPSMAEERKQAESIMAQEKEATSV